MKVGSLFSGGGLGDLGFLMAGCEIVFQVEIDEYCQDLLKLRFPNAIQYKDIKELDPKQLPTVDILTGGFPCQDVSVAGKGEGINGGRSGLWKEYLRIICGIRPNYVVVENVPALLYRGMETVLGDLAGIGYDCEWESISAADFGAPHERERLFLIAKPSGNDSRRVFNGKHAIRKNEFWKSTQNIKPKWGEWERWIIQNFSDINRKQDANFIWGMDDGGSSRVDRLKVLGNGQIPFITKWIAERIMDLNQP